MSNAAYNRKKILFLTQFSLLLAIEAIFCFVPILGSIPVGPMVATLSMLPVILTAILLGTGAGAAMGAAAGLFSLIVWTFMPTNPVVAFVFTPFDNGGNFWSLVICFLPRILVGVVSGATFRLFLPRLNAFAYILSGILGSLTNTILVLFGIYFFFGPVYAHALGKSYGLLLGLIGLTILTNGLPEAVLSAVVAPAVGIPVRKFIKKNSAVY